MKFEKLNTMEKIAMVWTTPMAIALAALTIVISVIVYLIRVVFVYSGTAGAAVWYIGAIREKWINKQWSKLKKRDQMIATLDQKMKS